MHKNTLRGFTLIELIVVIGIIAILTAIVIVAVNPSRQFAQARNAQRSSDVLAILNAIYQKAADNTPTGSFSTEISTLMTTTDPAFMQSDICDMSQTTVPPNNCAGFDFGPNGVANALAPTYISSIPHDPLWNTNDWRESGYIVKQAPGNRLSVCAPGAELGKTICATR